MTTWLNVLPSPLVALFGFIVTILFLVTIHEYGHFWMARRFGVRIERFSIGFGRPIMRWFGRRDNTEYCISWIPLGGYVKMYGETASQFEASGDTKNEYDDIACDVTTPSTQGSFALLPAWKRLLIALAGPMVNLVFAVLAFWILFLIGVPGTKPTIGQITPDSVISDSPLAAGDTITAIDGKPVILLRDASMLLLGGLGRKDVSISVKNAMGQDKTVQIDMSNLPKGSELNINQALGFDWAIDTKVKQLPAVIAEVSDNSPASRAGLLPGDRITAINNQPMQYFSEVVTAVQPLRNETIDLTVNRNGELQNLSLTTQPHPDRPSVGFIGVSPLVPENYLASYQTTKQFGPLQAIPNALNETVLQAKLMLKFLGRMIIGKASVENMGGPLTIADYSGQTLSNGFVTYLTFLAVISLTLAVMNLLPIPVLDGGHIMMCLAEMIKGKPLSEKATEVLMRLGMAVVLTFMLFVITLDLWRYLIL